MDDQGLVKLLRRLVKTIPAGVLQAFLYLSFGSLIVCGASFIGTLFPVGLAASKGTIDITSMGIAKIGQKGNAAVPAPLQAWRKAGMLSNNRTKLPEIPGRYLSSIAFSIPVPSKLKKGLKFNDKKAKSSLVWLIMLDIPSFSFHAFSQIHE